MVTLPKIGLFDWSLALMYLFLIYFFAVIYKNKKIKTNPEYKYYIAGLTTKIVGGIVFALVYTYYYKGGDTFQYYKGAITLNELLIESPLDYLRVLFTSHSNFPPDLKYLFQELKFARAGEEWLAIKLFSFVTLFSLNSYFVSTVLVSLLAFYGAWLMYRAFISHFPKMEKQVVIAVFFMPSVVFWGTGILKDTITLSFLGIFLWLFCQTFYYKKRYRVKNLILMFICVFIIFKIKAYIIVSFTPALLMGWFVNYKKNIKDKLLRVILPPFIFISLIVITSYTLVQVVNQNDKYNIGNLEGRVKGFHTWHTHQGGSSYNLGEIDYSISGVVKKIPASLNVTFFRPYLWEVSSPVVLIGAMESFLILMLFILVLVRSRLKWLKHSLGNRILITSLLFIIVFGFIVGFTSYNFGALARYKIPLMPFLGLFLLHYYKYGNDKLRIKEQ